MRPGRRTSALPAAVALCGLIVLGACGTKDNPVTPDDGTNLAGQDREFALIAPDERGDPVSLVGPLVGEEGTLDVASLRGKVVLINIWGSWCAPCRKEAPDLQAAWDKVKDLGTIQFLGLNTRDDAAGAAEAFERRWGITYPSLRDPDGSLQLVFRKTLPPRAIPSTIVLDEQGRVAARIIGVGTEATFRGLVEEISSED